MGDMAAMWSALPQTGQATAALTGAQAVFGAASVYQRAGALDAAADFNRRMAALQAQDALARGDQQAALTGAQTRRTVGYQKAAAAANGVDPGTGSALDTEASTTAVGAQDAATIRANAMREAWGLTTQADLDAAASRSEATATRWGAGQTLLTGAMRTYGLLADQNRPPGSSPTGARRQPRTNRGGY